ncbi:DUF961 domain-containing protein [Lactococcus protaetiae]|uniref:DUF961 domain-containing protein n=1 Tax=Lactococcus protaetiae TaxID=2592653 RepID=A0A514Z822_9LACT|nr:DUF961 domain-containing protein [Lactococcus protaetiae]QDK70740.1 DUF961 domain-containing protein [Lactococcus protaetiae]
MAKYGVEEFKDGQPIKYPINAEATYGILTFNGSEINEKFVYVDDEGEIHERQNERETWLAQNTGEITGKFILAYSSEKADVMDIKVPLDFDLERLTFGQKLKLVGASATVQNAQKEEKVTTRNGEQIRLVPCKVFPVQVENVEVITDKPQSQNPTKTEQTPKNN